MWRAFLELIRLPAVFSAPADVLGAAAFTAVIGTSIDPWNVVVLSLVSLLLYMGGMITNDLFDIEVDRQERPERPLPSGRFGITQAWLLALVMQGAAVGSAATLGRMTMYCAIAVCTLTYLYNGLTKSSVLGPFVMGLCRGANLYLGLSILPDLGWSQNSWIMCGVIVVYVSCITWVSRYEVGPVSDKGILAARVLRVSGGLTFFYWFFATTTNILTVLILLVPLCWLNLRLQPFGLRPISSVLKLEVIRGLGGILLVYASLSCVVEQFEITAVLVGCLLLGRITSRWFYAT